MSAPLQPTVLKRLTAVATPSLGIVPRRVTEFQCILQGNVLQGLPSLVRIRHQQIRKRTPSCPLAHRAALLSTSRLSVSVHLPLSIFNDYKPVVCNARQVVDL